jgi:hypothetical protein
MIVNPWSVSALTIDLLSTCLAVATVVQTGRLLFTMQAGKELTGQGVTSSEDKMYLAFWMGAVLLGIRFLAWPLFYLVLHSFIPEIEGAMCIFGTRNMLPILTRFIELLKPLLFFFGLVWIMLFRLERFATWTGKGRKAGGIVCALLLLCSLAALVDSIGSAALWMRSSSELSVSCCTTVTDIPSRFTVWMPVSLFGPAYEQPLWYLFFALNMVTACLLIFAWKRIEQVHSPLLLLSLTAMVAFANCVLTVIAYIEVVAPRLMRLPFHHCIYCMVQNVVDASIFVALFILGTCAAIATVPVWLLGRSWAKPKALFLAVRNLLMVGFLCLSGSVLMISIHLLIPFLDH